MLDGIDAALSNFVVAWFVAGMVAGAFLTRTVDWLWIRWRDRG